MRLVVQRVTSASVIIDNILYSEIKKGLLVLIGIEITDTVYEAEKLIVKLTGLRIFNDEKGLMNLSNADVNGDFLVVSQFTLLADTSKGNRPSYINAARPEQAIPLYEKFVELLKTTSGKEIKTGKFGADMQISLINDGPVTIIMDTKK